MEPRDIRRARWLWLMRHYWGDPDFNRTRFDQILGNPDLGQLPKEEREIQWEKRAKRSMELLLEDLPAASSWKILDLGCGMGRLLKELSPRVGQVWGVDFAPGMLRFARRYCAGLPNVKIAQNSGMDLALFRQGCFDCCFSVGTFEHIEFPEIVQGYIEEVWRVLKAGGWFRFQMSCRPLFFKERFLHLVGRAVPHGSYRPGWICRVLEKSHFQIRSLKRESFGKERWMLVTAVKPTIGSLL